MPLVRIVGPGRAGRSLAFALATAGWPAPELIGRGETWGKTRGEPWGKTRGEPERLARAAHGVDFLVLATPDAAIATVAAAIEPDPATVVVHLAGCHGLDVLAPHPRRAALHPLVALPDPRIGADRLRGASFVVSEAGDPAVRAIPAALGGRVLTLAEDPIVRARYHAAACIASNHLVALLGQVDRVAAEAGLPLDAYFELVRATVENVVALGPAAALTGPAARGDDETIDRHLDALPADERPAYLAMLAEARRLLQVPVCN